MNLPAPIVQRVIDRLAYSPVSFALYRLPWTDEPVWVMQEGDGPATFRSPEELNGKRGFVLTPFGATDEHPAVLIRPDRTATDWEEIEQCLSPFIEAYRKGELPLKMAETAGIAKTAGTAAASEPGRTAEAGTEGTETKVTGTGRMETEGTGTGTGGNAETAPGNGGTPWPDPVTEKASYFLAFHRFIGPLQQREYPKLVLSRRTCRQLPADFSPCAAFIRACNSYPRMMVSLCHTPQTGTWMGSTPEIILSGHERLWSTVALAGTQALEGEELPEVWSKKNQEEQAFVAEYIRRILKQWAGKVDEKGPYTARAGALAHLKTDFRFCLKDTRHLGDLLAELHPTPAVCGLPKQEAYEFILQNEGYDRQYYSGIIGWLDPEADTHLYVNLRCMQLTPEHATLYAGGGILPTSTAETEWEETQEKLKTMSRLLE